MSDIRHDWSKQEISDIYHMPLLELVFKASTLHNKYKQVGEVQVCTLLSVKTGGCSEDCSYCPQAARYNTDVEAEKLLDVEVVMDEARKAKEGGSTRFCMGAAWREVKDNKDFENVLEMVHGVNELGLEVCTTLGMLNAEQAEKLKEAGLTAYNHNLDTSEEKYEDIISTRKYSDRLNTIENVARANISVCSGGIIGLGESDDDRIGMLHTLSTMPKHPESIPVNALVPVKGTPLENNERVAIWDMIRMIATARIVVPTANVRLSAGRQEMSDIEQAMCFMAGANSVFTGDKLLTTPNPGFSEDKEMFALLGLTPRVAKKEETAASV